MSQISSIQQRQVQQNQRASSSTTTKFPGKGHVLLQANDSDHALPSANANHIPQAVSHNQLENAKGAKIFGSLTVAGDIGIEELGESGGPRTHEQFKGASDVHMSSGIAISGNISGEGAKALASFLAAIQSPGRQNVPSSPSSVGSSSLASPTENPIPSGTVPVRINNGDASQTVPVGVTSPTPESTNSKIKIIPPTPISDPASCHDITEDLAPHQDEGLTNSTDVGVSPSEPKPEENVSTVGVNSTGGPDSPLGRRSTFGFVKRFWRRVVNASL